MFKDISDEVLIKEAKELHTSIYIHESYGISDMVQFQHINGELNKRGYTPVETIEYIKEEV